MKDSKHDWAHVGTKALVPSSSWIQAARLDNIVIHMKRQRVEDSKAILLQIVFHEMSVSDVVLHPEPTSILVFIL